MDEFESLSPPPPPPPSLSLSASQSPGCGSGSTHARESVADGILAGILRLTRLKTLDLSHTHVTVAHLLLPRGEEGGRESVCREGDAWLRVKWSHFSESNAYAESDAGGPGGRGGLGGGGGGGLREGGAEGRRGWGMHVYVNMSLNHALGVGTCNQRSLSHTSM